MKRAIAMAHSRALLQEKGDAEIRHNDGATPLPASWLCSLCCLMVLHYKCESTARLLHRFCLKSATGVLYAISV